MGSSIYESWQQFTPLLLRFCRIRNFGLEEKRKPSQLLLLARLMERVESLTESALNKGLPNKILQDYIASYYHGAHLFCSFLAIPVLHFSITYHCE